MLRNDPHHYPLHRGKAMALQRGIFNAIMCCDLPTLTMNLCGVQVETNMMSASDREGMKDDRGAGVYFSAFNLNTVFLQKLKDDGECTW